MTYEFFWAAYKTRRSLRFVAVATALLFACVDVTAETMSRSVSVRDGHPRIYAPDQSMAVLKGVEIISTALWAQNEGSIYRLDTGSQIEVELMLPPAFRDVRFKVTLIGFPDGGTAAPVMLINRKRRPMDGPAQGETAQISIDGVDKDLVVGRNVLMLGSATGRVGLQAVEVFYDAPAAPVVPPKVDAIGDPAPKTLKPGEEFTDPLKAGGVGPKMVVIPADAFQMGSHPSEPGRYTSEGPVHVVSLAKAIAVGKFEVTFAEWDVCVLARACAPVDDSGWGRGKRPVSNVTYDEALVFTQWLAVQTGKPYRLLSESEWEYAARAGTTMLRHWENSDSGACQFANVLDRAAKQKYSGATVFECDDGHIHTSPVGSFLPNQYKLHDMMGNVAEWVSDCWNENYAGAPADGSAWTSGDCSKRVIRGGGWASLPALVRSAMRYGYPVGARDSSVGFRIARTLP